MRPISTTTLNNWNLPRQLPFKLRLAVLFGNIMFSMGLVFFLMGSIFIIVFGSQTDFTSSRFHEDTDPRAKGVITKVEATNSRENKRTIYRNTARYKVFGKEYYSDSYSVGSFVQVNDTVELECLENDPSVSRIIGMRKAPFQLWTLFLTGLFPLIGLVFLLIGVRRSRINFHLLKNGLHTHGKVTRKEITNTKINKQPVYKVYFTFTTKEGMPVESMVRTHRPHLVEDEEKEQLVYDASNPANAALIDTLPQSVRKFLETSA